MLRSYWTAELERARRARLRGRRASLVETKALSHLGRLGAAARALEEGRTHKAYGRLYVSHLPFAAGVLPGA